ncbi:MAG: hypothetical protein ABIR79_04270 [Candidatus Binatia bacterium]
MAASVRSCCCPLATPADALAEVLRGLRRVDNFAGAIVSMPRKTAIAECVVAPEDTRLLVHARARGCATHTGVPMLRSQMGLDAALHGRRVS